MTKETRSVPGAMTLAEIKEFASFSSATQRYIRRSLDVGLERSDAVETWSRDKVEEAGIQVQISLYRRIRDIRKAIPEGCAVDSIETFMPALISLAAYDLGQGRIHSFPAFRFLYERLLGPDSRPWLPGAFCAAAALPHLHPKTRKNLLQSISEAAATAPGWSNREPSFFPEWVEKVDSSRAAH
ncbi:hypothetical protein [Sphingorhabdus sp. SMR4y]|uniref:hypothetical protein n=1 Tax=Sphingorhabdus sp. SMR4y TaxID=2584094 RepID=UPI000B5CED56|nr:hypothetical protein [Sphingorhabdus sp. SMR4y]ASK88797.1 hypothetical protein SPHFLASMR4Y_02052 [Sphingorhabdus sp. SMR4y]